MIPEGTGGDEEEEHEETIEFGDKVIEELIPEAVSPTLPPPLAEGSLS